MKEREFTDAVAGMAISDPKFRLDLARSLLKTAAEHDSAAGRRGKEILRHLPRKHLDFKNQHSSINELGALMTLRELFGKPQQLWNFVDWVWESEDFLLSVEVKISGKTIFQPDQLSRYARAAKKARKPYFGVLALTTDPPSADALRRVSRRKGFLGGVLWSQAAPTLRKVSPSDPKQAEAWRSLLELVAPVTLG